MSDQMKPSKFTFNIKVTGKSKMATKMAAKMATESIDYIEKIIELL